MMTTVSAAGSDKQTDCHCDKGFYGNVNFTVGWSPCSPCPANYYCDGSKAGNHLAFCPNGTKSNLSSWVCSACQIDEYCAFGHVGACPDFSTSPISSWDVTQCICDAGYYGTAPDCKPCEPGSYCTGGKKIACTGNATSTPKSDDPTDCFCDRVRGRASDVDRDPARRGRRLLAAGCSAKRAALHLELPDVVHRLFLGALVCLRG